MPPARNICNPVPDTTPEVPLVLPKLLMPSVLDTAGRPEIVTVAVDAFTDCDRVMLAPPTSII